MNELMAQGIYQYVLHRLIVILYVSVFLLAFGIFHVVKRFNLLKTHCVNVVKCIIILIFIR